MSETRSEAKENTSELHLSRFISVFLLLLYICYLFFQLYTHRYAKTTHTHTHMPVPALR